MKKKFSIAWKSSKQPRKQRKYLANAPLHVRRKMLGSNLSKELRKKFGKRNLSLKKGDDVKVMRGKLKGKTGKIIRVYTKKSMVEIEGLQVKKQDGSKSNIKFRPSNLQITGLNLEDKKRNKSVKKESEEKKKDSGKDNKVKDKKSKKETKKKSPKSKENKK
ncbi:MAG: 50S ribosomal protein L24 [Candidatus Pacearchaeota archaeon]